MQQTVILKGNSKEEVDGILCEVQTVRGRPFHRAYVQWNVLNFSFIGHLVLL